MRWQHTLRHTHEDVAASCASLEAVGHALDECRGCANTPFVRLSARKLRTKKFSIGDTALNVSLCMENLHRTPIPAGTCQVMRGKNTRATLRASSKVRPITRLMDANTLGSPSKRKASSPTRIFAASSSVDLCAQAPCVSVHQSRMPYWIFVQVKKCVSLVKQKKVHMLCKHLVLMPSSIWNAGVELSPFDKPNDGRRCPTSCRIGYDLRLSIDHSRYSRIRRSKVYSDGPPIQSNLVFGCRG